MHPSRHIGAKLKTLSSTLTQEANRRTAEVDLTGSQAFFLGYLIRNGDHPIYPKDLERDFDFSHPTVSGILRRMEKKGFVTFRPGKTDKRCKQILITEQGLNAHAAVIRNLDEIEEHTLRGLSEAEIHEFHRLLDTAMKNLGADLCCRLPGQEEPK